MVDSAQLAPPPISLIVGLGNPGAKYDRTRHNVGFDAIDRLAKRWQIPLAEQRRFHGELGEGMVAGQRMRLLKPNTFMNKSGQSVRAVLDWYKLLPQQVLVLYDDMDLPVGKLRIRLSGSAGGHNGMKSLIAHLGTQDFPRLRIGISKAAEAGAAKDTISHVLGKFTPEELQILPEVLDMAADAVELALRQGMEKSMSLYNGRSVDGVKS
ncbi:aminoacyl-tRNA hydrolase [Altericista sp. CCNU0014]|uniref:aminoacyl-tRNA hydrolase n=1 Tax=Altericista sp. CCNU0014 TaxID=3082949 RepID=UPI00384CEA5D